MYADCCYGGSDDNLGNQCGDTFWQASRQILEQAHALLAPGGVAVWVTGDFIRKGKRVPFSEQWAALCEAVGFRLIHHHVCWKVKRGAEQITLEGGIERKDKQHVSFFRRLATRKGSPAILNEDVLCTIKPVSPDRGALFDECACVSEFSSPMYLDPDVSRYIGRVGGVD